MVTKNVYLCPQWKEDQGCYWAVRITWVNMNIQFWHHFKIPVEEDEHCFLKSSSLRQSFEGPNLGDSSARVFYIILVNFFQLQISITELLALW